MAESILIYHDKITLRNMAVERGLTRHGFNGRNMSRMRKQDLVDFILYQDHPPSSSTLPTPITDSRLILESDRNNESEPDEHLNSNSITEEEINHNNEEEEVSSSEDEMINIFEELLVSDSFQPIFHIMDALYGLQNERSIKEKQYERIPNEEDESVPNLALQELIVSKNICDMNCDCNTCQKNNNIIEENLKVQINVRELETRITCVICRCNVRNVIFNPCNHLATCITCSKNPLLDKKCPLCRKVYTYSARVFC